MCIQGHFNIIGFRVILGVLTNLHQDLRTGLHSRTTNPTRDRLHMPPPCPIAVTNGAGCRVGQLSSDAK
jgi:hypothetical protein